MKVCRLCLHEEPNELISVLNNEDIVEKIKECVSIEITEHDELPTTACDGCIKKIRDWSSFKEICHRSSKVLLELMQKKAKCSGKDKSRRFEDKYSFLEEDSNSEDVKYLLVVEDEKQEFYVEIWSFFM
jgi:hypothetical protein